MITYRKYAHLNYTYLFSNRTTFSSTVSDVNEQIKELSTEEAALKIDRNLILNQDLVWTEWTSKKFILYESKNIKNQELIDSECAKALTCILDKIKIKRGQVDLIIKNDYYEHELVIPLIKSSVTKKNFNKLHSFFGGIEGTPSQHPTRGLFTVEELQNYLIHYDTSNKTDGTKRGEFYIRAIYEKETGFALIEGTYIDAGTSRSALNEFDRDDYFLKLIDNAFIKEQNVRLIILNRKDKLNPETIDLNTLQGRVLNGSITINNRSAIRRIGQLTMIVDDDTKNILTNNNLINISTRFALEVGYTNFTPHYRHLQTIWYPEGVFAVTDCSISEDASGLKISLNFKDKSVLLNGELGGAIPGDAIFNRISTVNEQGESITVLPLVKDIVKGLVCGYGGLSSDEVVIDIPEKTYMKLRWGGLQPAYLIQGQGENNIPSAYLDIDKKIIESYAIENKGIISEYKTGASIGYRWTNFTLPEGSLKASPGDNVLNVLSKIIQQLPTYSFYFDTYGTFYFREREGFKTNGSSQEEQEKSYIFEENDSIVSRYNNHPQYLNIKNDFIVLGEMVDDEGLAHSLLCHYAYDRNPPMVPAQTFIPVNSSNNNNVDTMIEIAEAPIDFIRGYLTLGVHTSTIYMHQWDEEKNYKGSTSIPITPGIADSKTGLVPFSSNSFNISNFYHYIWFTDQENAKDNTTSIQLVCSLLNKQSFTQKSNNSRLYQATDTDSQIFLAGPSENPYYAELQAYGAGLVGEVTDDYIIYESERYYLCIDRTQQITPTNQFSLDVSDIGRRTKVHSNVGVNCLRKKTTPADVYILNVVGDISDDWTNATRQLNVTPEVGKGLKQGGADFSALEFLYNCIEYYTPFNETIQLTINPLYYLDANHLIQVKHTNTSIDGEYVISSFTIPLDVQSQMVLSCTRNIDVPTIQ